MLPEIKYKNLMLETGIALRLNLLQRLHDSEFKTPLVTSA